MRSILLCSLIFFSANPVGFAQDVVVFQGQEFMRRREFTVGEARIAAYSTDKPADKSSYFHFTVQAKDRLPALYRYQVQMLAAGPGAKSQLVLFLREEPAKADDRPEPIRIAVKASENREPSLDAAEALVKQAEQAAPVWFSAKAPLKDGLDKDRAKALEAWRKLTVNLEEARQKHPWHLGILRDLIGAYTNLNAFEGKSARGSNLCMLIPNSIAEFELNAGTLLPFERTEFRRTLAVLFFQIELYPFASAEIEKAKGDADLANLAKSLKALGQDQFAKSEPFVVKEKSLRYRVDVYQTKGQAADPKQIYHHWYFLPRPEGAGDAPGRVWFTLSSQTLTKEPRYYLYGWSGNQRKVLMLYGTQKPDFANVQRHVTERVTDALRSVPDPKKK